MCRYQLLCVCYKKSSDLRKAKRKRNMLACLEHSAIRDRWQTQASAKHMLRMPYLENTTESYGLHRKCWSFNHKTFAKANSNPWDCVSDVVVEQEIKHYNCAQTLNTNGQLKTNGIAIRSFEQQPRLSIKTLAVHCLRKKVNVQKEHFHSDTSKTNTYLVW